MCHFERFFTEESVKCHYQDKALKDKYTRMSQRIKDGLGMLFIVLVLELTEFTGIFCIGLQGNEQNLVVGTSLSPWNRTKLLGSVHYVQPGTMAHTCLVCPTSTNYSL